MVVSFEDSKKPVAHPILPPVTPPFLWPRLTLSPVQKTPASKPPLWGYRLSLPSKIQGPRAPTAASHWVRKGDELVGIVPVALRPLHGNSQDP